MGNNMSNNLGNLNDSKIQDGLNKYLSSSEGAEEAAKSMPIVLGNFVQNTQDSFKDLGEQVLVSIDSMDAMSKQMQQMGELIKGLMDHVGYKPQGGQQPQASGQIQPTQPTQPQQSDLGDLGNILNQIRQNSQQSQQQ